MAEVVRRWPATALAHLRVHYPDFDYDKAGDLVRVTDPAGVFLEFSYDAAYGRLSGLTDPSGACIFYDHDTQGNRIEENYKTV